MATSPTSVEIRSYQVGFGDCILLSFVYGETAKRHVLIDFGSSELPRGLKPSTYMPRVAQDIRTVCGGKLHAVVATHRHRDHISGFATDGTSGHSGSVIADCQPDVVLQPWTEDPRAATNATSATRGSSRTAGGFIEALASMHRIAEAVEKMSSAPPAWMSATMVRQLRFIGQTNVKNKSAVMNLIAMGERPGATAVWARHGASSGLSRVLPGVKVHVLGPPDLTQTKAIKTMASSNPDEFWSMLSGPRASMARGTSPGIAAGKGAGRAVPPEARWFRDRLERITAEQLLEIVTVLDEQMNNTSLILLFEVGRKKLLFPGDAQLENWGYALRDAPTAKATAKLLSTVDLYKVGHHGSRNATPRQLLWEGMRKRGTGGKARLTTILSTMPGKHPGVPRPSLLEALEQQTVLHNTNRLRLGAKMDLYDLVTVVP